MSDACLACPKKCSKEESIKRFNENKSCHDLILKYLSMELEKVLPGSIGMLETIDSVMSG